MVLRNEERFLEIACRKLFADLRIGIYREAPGARIPGGSEDVLLDLAVRQLVKNYKSQTSMLERPRGSSKL